MEQWKIGCSGFLHDEWRDIFYPRSLPRSKWFEFYCEHFKTLEINTTFYRFPRVEFLKNWHKRSPSDFSFCLKAPQLITHFNKLAEVQQYMQAFYNTVRNGLREKLGCVLFQFPTTFAYTQSHLERIAQYIEPSICNVFEFRNSSWWNKEALEFFKQNQLTIAGISHPQLPEEVLRTTDTLYYRLHGLPHIYISPYTTESLETLAATISHMPNVQQANIFFNNTAKGEAIANAKAFQEITTLVH